MLKLIVYIPEDSLEKVKTALFTKGAGKDDKYESCCWQTPGQMQFKPLATSHPAKGEKGKLTVVQEYKVEMICLERFIDDVIAVLKEIHPYERPAYEVYKLEQY